MRDEAETGDVWPLRRAKLHALLSETEAAMDWLEQEKSLLWFRAIADPDFDSLRSDPRVAARLERFAQRQPATRP